MGKISTESLDFIVFYNSLEETIILVKTIDFLSDYGFVF